MLACAGFQLGAIHPDPRRQRPPDGWLTTVAAAQGNKGWQTIRIRKSSYTGKIDMDNSQALLQLLDDALNLGGRALQFDRSKRLLGALPEMDSMAVVSVISALEETWGLTIDDSEISADVFATVGSLQDFVEQKQAQYAPSQVAC